ncbi:hypothetical protein GCM10007863_33830 [Dyella mobilis]|nr:hypothetical protein GCM10007863_33830 [Dyella mobilis]
MFNAVDIEALGRQWFAALHAMLLHVEQPDAGGLTPSDLPLVTLDQAAIEQLERTHPLADILPLSPLQEGLLFHALYDHDAADAYLTQMVFALEGPWQPDALQRAAHALLARHPQLCAAFVQQADGQPTLQLIPRDVPNAWQFIDLADLPRHDREEALQRRVQEDRQRRFDPARLSLRFTLIRLSPQDYRLLFTHHHVLLDGWSMPILLPELFAIYHAGNDRALPYVRPYRDYLDWLADQDREAMRELWRQSLEGVDQPCLLAAQHTAPGVPQLHQHVFSTDLTQALDAQARRHGFTVNTLLQAAWALLLNQATGRDDTCFGITVSGRPPELAGVERMVGLFINTVPLRLRIDPRQSLRELLAELQDAQATLIRAQHLGLSEILQLSGQRELFDTLLVFENYPFDPADRRVLDEQAGLRVAMADHHGGDVSHYPLSLVFVPGERLQLRIGYQPDAFATAQIQALAERYGRILEALSVDLSKPVAQLDLLSRSEHEQWRAWNATAHAISDATLSALIEQQAARTPDAVAAAFEDVTLSYAELNRRANRLAHLLMADGAGPESIVGIALPRSLDLIVALLAVLKSGAAYLPLDTDYPPERLAFMLEDARPATVLTRSDVQAALPSDAALLHLDDARTQARLDASRDHNPSDAERTRPLHALHPAYVIYTSGSTGRPKGVPNTHQGIVNRLQWMQHAYGLQADDAVLQKTPSSFDVSVWEFFWPLLQGARLVLARPEGHRDPAYLAALIQRQNITTAHFVPSMLEAFLHDPASAQCTSLRRILCSGEALPGVLRERVRDVLDRPLHNLYGPTEAAVDVTAWACRDDERGASVPIGAPIWNIRTYVLDAALRPLPPGATGELYLAGIGLARGYLHRPGLSAERFVANPFDAGQRMYRTGDLARWRSDGQLEYQGRIDHQVKLRGLRIELGEIEAALARLGHAQNVVIARNDPRGEMQLVAYVVAEQLDADTLRSSLAAHLPDYMLPAAFVAMAALPLSLNGKLDRKALPAPDFAAQSTREPRNAQEALLCKLFADVLGLPRVGIDDDFFACGGHSLLAVRLAGRIRVQLGVELPLRTLFETRSVAHLAPRLGSAAATRPALQKMPRPEALPLSFAQHRLLFLQQLEGPNATYNIPVAAHLHGKLDREALHAALHDVVVRHESLRTVFSSPAQPVQHVLAAEDSAVTLVHHDVTPATLDAALHRAAQHPFDLTRELPLRATTFRLGGDEHVLLLLLHHVAADGASLAPLLHDLSRAYAARCDGRAPSWPDAPLQYVDYTLWQRQLLGDETDPHSLAAAQIAYWKQRLDGAPEQMALPSDRPRPAVASHCGDSIALHIPAALHRRLLELANTRQATLHAVLHAALAALLNRLGAGDDIVLGTPVAGRSDQALDGMVGLFLNTLVLRTDLSGRPSFNQMLARVQENNLQAYAQQDLPFEQLVEAINPARSLAHHPLFQVLFALHNTDTPQLHLHGMEAGEHRLDLSIAKFDLNLDFVERRGADGSAAGIDGNVGYATDLFDRTTVEALAARMLRLLEAVAADPEQPLAHIDVLTTAEREQLLHACNDTAYPLSGLTLPQRFEEQTAAYPDEPALLFEQQHLTYAQLNERANRFAHVLITAGIGTEDIVAIALPRSSELLVALLGVMKAGAAYLPLDPDYPPQRLHYMLEDARPAALIATTAQAALLEQGSSSAIQRRFVIDTPTWQEAIAAAAAHDPRDDERRQPLHPQHPAYVIYTSGSTGRPKGVMVEHRALDNFLQAMVRTPGLAAGERVLALTPISFDIAGLELYLPLIRGACVQMLPRDVSIDADRLRACIEQTAPDVIQATPATWQMLRACGWNPTPSLRLLCGGEALPADLAAYLCNRGAQLWNVYGPTETTVWSLISRIEPSMPVTIGTPLDNTRTYLLDRGLQPVPVGVPGELYLAGEGLARGYLHRAALSAERFVANPFECAARMYRTGDLARRRADGQLHYLGRVDNQVKLRGFRIELGEIETALAALGHPRNAVLVREDRAGQPQLVAYLTGEAIDVAALRMQLAQRLPDYMLPAAFVSLAALPLTPNGKLDRKALPAPELAERVTREPRNAQEAVLCALFADVLGLPQVGTDDSFFELGGHSLLATRLVSRIRARLSVEVAIRTLFEAPTVAQLSPRLARNALRPALRRRERPASLPLSHAQRRLWFIQQFEGRSATYNIPMPLRLSGTLDAQSLEQALRDVIGRHESLRTVFAAVDGVPEQRILDMHAVDLSLAAEPVDADALADVLAEAAGHGFDLARETPLRARLFRLNEQEHVLMLVLHHIAGDGGSFAPMARDVARAYGARLAGQAPEWPSLPVQYADYTLWQHELLGREDDPQSLLSTQFNYWKQALRDLPECIALPTDRPRPAVSTHRGKQVALQLDADLHGRLLRLAKQQQGTLFMLLHAGLAALLTRLGAGHDIAIGGAIAGRTDQALDELIGFFVNTLVLRTDTAGNPRFSQLLQQVRETALAAYAHQDAPFERLVELLNPARSTSHHPLFQVGIVLQNAAQAKLELPGLQLSVEPADFLTAKLDLLFNIVEATDDDGTPQGLKGFVEYATDLFDAETVETLLRRWIALLDAVTVAPDTRIGDIDLLDTHEHRQLLVWSVSARDVAEATLPVLFERQVAATPDATAAACGDETLSYAQLNARANRLARALIARGIGPEDRIALAVPRSLAMPVAMLGILKAGAAYVPLDPAYPAERLAYMLNDACPALLLTDVDTLAQLPVQDIPTLLLDAADSVQWLAAQAPADLQQSERRRPLRTGHAAYVIYTSGSTGRPKGVMVTHAGVASLASGQIERFGVQPHSRVLQFASLSFDAAFSECCMALLSGAALVMAPKEALMPGDALIELAAKQRITHVTLPPSALSVMAPEALPGITHLVIAGEACAPHLVDAWSRGRCLINAYGPTETTVCASMSEALEGEQVAPIGRPIHNARLYVLDEQLQPVPAGVPGELYIAGTGLARGYVGRAALTAERFVANPFQPGTRMYRSGDLARWRNDGQLDYLGRVDTQLKIRGFRIEPGEIEAALQRHPAVAQAAVIAREDVPGHKQLVGYVVLDRDASKARDTSQEQRQVGEWQTIYEKLHGEDQEQQAGQDTGFGDDFGGWNSSYDGQPLPLADMQAWRAAAVERILALKPRTVLEIGVGSGLILAKVAPHCDSYWGTDLSRSTIELLRGRLRTQPEIAARVRLNAQPAHVMDGLPAGHFDAIVLNSVLQYFPSADYLTDVLRQAFTLLAPGGAIFLGDVRNLHLHRCFASTVQIQQADADADAASVRRRIEQTLLAEKELLLAPEYFAQLPQQVDGLAAVDIQTKRARYSNELSRHRYDVVLHKAPRQVESLARLPQLAVGSDVVTLRDLQRHLQQQPARLRLTGLGNSWLAPELAAMQALHAGGDATAWQARLHEEAHVEIDSEAVRTLGEALGYRVAVTWSSQGDGLLDALLVKDADASAVFTDIYLPCTEARAAHRHANDPSSFERFGDVRRFIASQLPEHLLPTLVLLPVLPLTPNGKLNRKALPAPEFTPSAQRAPRNAQEQVLAQLYAEVLGLPRVGVQDSFFDLGGDSIISIQLVSRARKAGLLITPRDVFQHQSVAALAQIARPLENDGTPTVENVAHGEVLPTPIIHWLLDRSQPFERFCQSVLLQVPAELGEDALAASLQALLDHHDALRMQLSRESSSWHLHIPLPGSVDARSLLQRVDISSLDPTALQSCLSEQAQAAECRLAPMEGRLLQAVWFDAGNASGRLLLVIHHLAVDGVSWRILLPALQQAWQALRAGKTVQLDEPGHSFRYWAAHLAQSAASRQAELPLWQDVLSVPDPLLSTRAFDPQRDNGHTVQRLSVTLPAELTRPLLTEAPARFHGQVNDILLSAFALAVADWRRRHTGADTPDVLLDLEGHGRETDGTGIDLSRTVGWFTSLFPLRLNLDGVDLHDALQGGAAMGRAIKRAKEQLRALPDHGLGYGVLRYLDAQAGASLAAFGERQLAFNYLGRVPAAQAQDWGVATEQTGVHGDPAMPPAHAIELNALTREHADGAEFVATWSWAGALFSAAQMEDLAQTYTRALRAVVTHVQQPQSGGLTPSDVPLVALDQARIEALEARYPLRDILPLSPLQKGLLFHALYDPQGPDAYAVQVRFDLEGPLDPDALQQAAHALLQRHPQLGAAFVHPRDSEPVQLLPREVPLDWRWHDLRAWPLSERAARAESIELDDRQARFDLSQPPLLRFTLLRLADERHQLLLTNHHILLDGWSLPVLTQELFQLYSSVRGKPQRLAHATPYRDYLGWLARRDSDAARNAWSEALHGLEQATLLAPAQRDTHAAQHNHAWLLPEPLTRKLAQQARSLGLTLNSVLQSAWGLMLGHLCGRDDVVFGGTVSGRPPELPDVGRMVGLFINTLPIRLHWKASQTLAEVLLAAQARQASLLEHQHLDLAEIQQLADLGPLFDSLYVFENYPIDSHALENALGELRVAGFHSHDATHYPLSLLVNPGTQLSLRLNYDARRFDEAAIARVAERLSLLLETIAIDPQRHVGRIDLLDPSERHELLVARNASARELPFALQPDQFAQQAAATPDADAVIDAQATLSYAELNCSANRLAHLLMARGIGPERRVALALPRSAERVVALLAILKSGAAYLPLDPDYPRERLAYMLDDAQPDLLISDSATAEHVPGSTPSLWLDDTDLIAQLWHSPTHDPRDDERVRPLRPEHPAYVIYTSGSTGRPKGVVVCHAGIPSLAHAQAERFGIDGHSRVLQLASLSFDAASMEMLMAFAGGAALVTPPPGILLGQELAETIERYGVTHALIPPSALASVDPAQVHSLHTLIVGGEACPAHLVQSWSTDTRRVINAYGPTESTICAAMSGALHGHVTPPLGRPVWNTRLYVLDAALQPVPEGCIGELYIAGAGLARGYLGRAPLTAERFLANPFEAGQRMYRSGDLARWRADGQLDYCGRADSQVKLRGFRIELGEIEAALAQLGFAGNAVIVREDQPGQPQLTAYLVTDALDADHLREQLGKQLPEHLVPSAFVALDQLPLTPNGKLDHRALPAPHFTSTSTRAPRTLREQQLCALFAEVLGVAQVGIDDNFFALGGHSLLATRLISYLRDRLRVEVGIRTLFEAPTVEALARALPQTHDTRLPLQAMPRPAQLPLSFAQRRLWFLHQLEGPSATYNIPLAMRLEGPVNVAALQAALDDLIARHESLRTLFPRNDVPQQYVLAQAALVLEHRDVEENGLAAALADASAYAFDLSREIPLRARLLRLAPQRHVLVLLLHHIAGDGASMAPMARDVIQAYVAHSGGHAPAFAPLPVQYADYTLWQRALLGDETDPHSVLAHQLAYWRNALADLPEQIALPTDRARPGVQSYRGHKLDFELDAVLHRRLLAVTQEHGVTLFMVLQAALAALLSRLGGGTDIPIGSPIAGRTDAALENLVGLFLNTLVLRTDTSGNPSFSTLLARVRDTDLAAYEHQDLPFEQLVDVLNPVRSLAHQPLFQVTLTLQNTAHALLDVPGMQCSLQPLDWAMAKFDLSLEMSETQAGDGSPAGLRAHLVYATDLFDEGSVRVLIRRYVQMLQAIATDSAQSIGQVDLLDANERTRLLLDWNDTACERAPTTLPAAFAVQAARTPDAVAAVAGRQSLRYRELDARANQLAHRLRQYGVGPDTLVGLCVERSLDSLIATLGILKAGAAYLPLDPQYPAERLAHVLEESAAPVLIAHGTLRARLPVFDGHVLWLDEEADAIAAQPASPPALNVQPDHLAYVMYTSGSTGVPKGIAVTHRNVVELALDRRWQDDCQQRVLLHSPQAFDASTYEIWAPLLSGRQIVVAPPGKTDIHVLRQAMLEHRVTSLWLTAGLFHLMVDECSDAFAHVQQVLAGGDVLSPAHIRRLLAQHPHLRVVNGYGPTETTTFATNHVLRAPFAEDAGVPIGRPLDNTRLYVLDQALQPVPAGVAGELYIAGSGLARGYLRRAALSAERFVADPFGPPGSRMYRTSDVARWRNDGVLVFEGRSDHQVKIRGFRIELGDIETALRKQAGVIQAAVVARQDQPGHKQLVAYLVAAPGHAIDPDALRTALAASLPDYMVPAAIVTLDQLPLTANGKLDRKALPTPTFASTSTRLPQGELETLLCGLFAEVLGLPQVGVDDNFFNLGGDSIGAIQLVSRARKAGLQLSVGDVFQHQTVHRLATVAKPLADAAATPQHAASGSLPATPIMHWLFDQQGPLDAFHQSMPLAIPPMPRADLVQAVQALLDHHDALRMRVTGARQCLIEEAGNVSADTLVHSVSLRGLSDEARQACMREQAVTARNRLSLADGRLLQVISFDDDAQSLLLVMIHHLVVDGVSWRILLPDLQAACQAVAAGRPVVLEPVPTSFRHWAMQLPEAAARRHDELPLWQAMFDGDDPRLGQRALDPACDTFASLRSLSLRLDAQTTHCLLTLAPQRIGGQINDVLLAAFALAVIDWRHRQGLGHAECVRFDLEGHGREAIVSGTDLSRTVGWFTSLFPLQLDVSQLDPAAAMHDDEVMERVLKQVKEQLRQLPDRGIGYGLLRYLDPLGRAALAAQPARQIGFNYLGRFATAGDGEGNGFGGGGDDMQALPHVLELSALVEDGTDGPQLCANWMWADAVLEETAIHTLAETWFAVLRRVAAYAIAADGVALTPSDVPMVSLDQNDIEFLESLYAEPEN